MTGLLVIQENSKTVNLAGHGKLLSESICSFCWFKKKIGSNFHLQHGKVHTEWLNQQNQ